jgi:sortase (surface protein transpeptidase)
LIYWKDHGIIKDYVYQVYKTLLVSPDQTFVRNYEGKGKEITLYTCGPEVGQNNKRLVVKVSLLS